MRVGWQIKRLGDVCITVQDGAHESPKLQFDSPGNGRFLYITSKNIRNNHLDLDNVSYVDEGFHDRIYPRCRPSLGDVLLTKDGANTGNVTLNTLDEPFSLLSSVCLIKTAPDSLLPSFLSYFIQSPDGLKSITGQMTGAAIKRIILRDIKLAEIPIPPLPEQQRIVALLDEAFAGLATAKANAERNLQNARAIFESHLQSVFSQRGEGWVEKALESCCEQIFAGGDVPKDRLSKVRTSQYSVPIYSNGEKGDGLYGFTDIARVTEPSVTVSARGTLGFSAIRTEPFLPVVRLIVLVPDTGQISLPFLYYAVIGMNFGNTGTSIPQLTVPNIKESKLHHPPLSEQIDIVKKLDALTEETQRLTRLYERKLAALEELKKSLLHQAFNGEL